MQVISSASDQLPRAKANAKSKAMSSDTHLQLCQWLKAIATCRDKQAFTCLFQFFAPKIQRIAYGKFNNETQAKEVLQETMSIIWRKAHLFNQDKGAATTWIYTITRNVMFDMLRKIKSNREDNLSEEIWPLIESEEQQEDSNKDHLEQNKILGVIEQLPEPQKTSVKRFLLQRNVTRTTCRSS